MACWIGEIYCFSRSGLWKMICYMVQYLEIGYWYKLIHITDTNHYTPICYILCADSHDKKTKFKTAWRVLDFIRLSHSVFSHLRHSFISVIFMILIYLQFKSYLQWILRLDVIIVHASLKFLPTSLMIQRGNNKANSPYGQIIYFG